MIFMIWVGMVLLMLNVQRIMGGRDSGVTDCVLEAASTICKMRDDGSQEIDDLMVQVRKKTVLRKGIEYELGDMVWGKVESHPWWPGQIFDEAFASSSVRETKREGPLLVSFYGDDTFGWFSSNELVPFNPYFFEKSRQTSAKSFLDAVDHAKCEISRRAALGLSCCCQNPSNFRPTGVRGCFEVDVDGYEPDAIYTRKQIELARDGFEPIRMLCFLQGLALKPICNAQHSVEWIKRVAVILAYRRMVVKKSKQTLLQAFGTEGKQTQSSAEHLGPQGKVPCQVSLNVSPEVHASINVNKSSSRPGEVKRETFYKKQDISRLHYPEETKNLLSPPMNEKKVALAARDHHIQAGALAHSVILKSAQKDVICRFDSEAEEATSRNRKSELESISSTNFKLEQKWKPQSRLAKVAKYCYLSSSDFVGKTSSLSAVAIGGKTLPDSEKRNKKPKLSKCFEEELPSAKVTLVDKSKTKEETELEAGPQNPRKHLISGRKESSPGNRAGKPSQTVSVCAKDSLKHQPGEAREAHCSSFKELPSTLKPPKKRLRLDDYAMVGENKNSCSKENMAMKGPKKLRKLNSLSSERKALNHNRLNYQANDEKERDLPPPRKLSKHIIKKKKPENRINAAQPAKLVMEFPPQYALPSVSELKAKFARFGPFRSAPCISWKSSTCQIIFKWRHDAQAAYRYATQTKSLFGSARVTLEPEAPKSVKFIDEPSKLMSNPPRQKNLHSSTSKLKSCLKMPEADGAALSGTNWLNVVPQPQHPSHPFCNQIAKNEGLDQLVEACNARQQMTQIEVKNDCVITNSTTLSVDVSSQMLSLLTRCSEIVSNLKYQLGYVPIRL